MMKRKSIFPANQSHQSSRMRLNSSDDADPIIIIEVRSRNKETSRVMQETFSKEGCCIAIAMLRNGMDMGLGETRQWLRKLERLRDSSEAFKVGRLEVEYRQHTRALA